MNGLTLTEGGIVVPCPKCGQRNRLKYEKLQQEFKCGQCHSPMSFGLPVDVPSDASFLAAIANASIPVLVDFWAPWCGPCKMVAPEVEKLAGELSGQVLVLKVNTEELPYLAQRYSITGIPTFMLFSGGHVVGRQSGAMSAVQLRRFATEASAQAAR